MVSLKKNFRVQSKIGAFYSGGQVQVTSDGEHLFCPYGSYVNVLSTATGRVVHTLKQDDDAEVTCICLSPDDTILVAAYRNLLLKQWSWKEETCTRTWMAVHTAPIISMAFEETSTLLATGSSDSTIKVWDITQQYCTHNLKGSSGVVNIVEFCQQNEKLELFSAAADNIIRVWDLQTSKCKHELAKHYGTITSLTFAKNRTTMYSAGRDSVVIVWNLDTYTAQRTIPVFEPLESVMCLPDGSTYPNLNIKQDGQYLITAGVQGELKVWDASSGRLVYTQKDSPMKAARTSESMSDASSQVTQVTLGASCDSIMVVTFDHNILFFDVENFSQQKQFVGNNEEVLDVKLFGPGQSHLAVVTNSSQIRVYEVATLNCQLLYGHTDIILSLAVFRKGLMLASGSKDNTIRLWQMDQESKTISCVAIAKGHTHSVLSLCTACLSASWLASGGEDCTIKFWNVPSEFEVPSVGKLPQLTVRYTERAHEKSINSLAVSPNDKFLATGSQDKTAKLYHVENQDLVGVFRGHKRGIWCVQFSPSDQALATSSADGSIKIWSLSDFSCVKTFVGHDVSVLKMLFITKGMQILSSGSDGLLKLWTIKNNECITTFDEHTEKVWGLDRNKKETVFVSGGADGTIIIWDDVTQIEQEEEMEKQEQLILQEQQLNNFIKEKKFLKALKLAITLDQPFNVLKILKTVLDDKDGHMQIVSTLKKLREDQVGSILGFIRVWNTNSKHCHIAQTVLSIILQNFSTDDLMTFPNIKEILEGLLPYTERHLHRMNRLTQQATFVEFLWQSMRRAADSGQDADQEMLSNPSSFDVQENALLLGHSEGMEPTRSHTANIDEETSDSSDSDDEVDSLAKDGINIAKSDQKISREGNISHVTSPNGMQQSNLHLGHIKQDVKSFIRQVREGTLRSVGDSQDSDLMDEGLGTDLKMNSRRIVSEDELLAQQDATNTEEDSSFSTDEQRVKRRRSGKDLVKSIQRKRKSIGSKTPKSGKVRR